MSVAGCRNVINLLSEYDVVAGRRDSSSVARVQRQAGRHADVMGINNQPASGYTVMIT